MISASAVPHLGGKKVRLRKKQKTKNGGRSSFSQTEIILCEYFHGNTVQKTTRRSGRLGPPCSLPKQVLTFAIAIEGQQQTRSHISINKVRHWDLIKSRCSCNCAMFMPTVATLFVCPAKNGTNRIEDWRLMRRDELPPLGTLARGEAGVASQKGKLSVNGTP